LCHPIIFQMSSSPDSSSPLLSISPSQTPKGHRSTLLLRGRSGGAWVGGRCQRGPHSRLERRIPLGPQGAAPGPGGRGRLVLVAASAHAAPTAAAGAAPGHLVPRYQKEHHQTHGIDHLIHKQGAQRNGFTQSPSSCEAHKGSLGRRCMVRCGWQRVTG
jgi:hypothetical protein